MKAQNISEKKPLQLLVAWMQRVESREKLKTLSDRSLKDIGLTRPEIAAEVRKPFWKA